MEGRAPPPPPAEAASTGHDEDKHGPAVRRFVEVTNCANGSFAASFLEAHGWDLERGIEAFLSGDDGTGISSASGGGSSEDGVRAPIPAVQDTLIDATAGFGGGVVAPSGFNPRMPRTIFDAFRDYRQEEALQQSTRHSPLKNKRVERMIKSRPTAEQKKLRTLAHLFRPPFELLFNGTFEEAKREGARTRKWLLVNVQDVQEFASSQLNRDTWAKPELKQLIGDHLVMMQYDRDSEEGRRYSFLYKLTAFPHVGLIDPRTGQLLLSWSGFVDAATLGDQIEAFLAAHSLDDRSAIPPPPQAPRAQKSKADLTEEEMLAEAIAASLRESNDSCPTEEPVAASKKRKLIVETESDKDDDSEDADALGQETKRAKVAHQPENVEEEHEQTSGDMGATCTLQIRAMDGSSITHTFREEDTLGKVRQWLVDNRRLGGSSSFVLVTPFPRRTYGEEDLRATLRSLGLTPRAVLIVHPTSACI